MKKNDTPVTDGSMLRCYREFLEWFPWKQSEFPTYEIWICSDKDDARIFRQGWAARCRASGGDPRKGGGGSKMLGEGSDDHAKLRAFFPWLSQEDFDGWIERSSSSGAPDTEIDDSQPLPSRRSADQEIGGN